MLDLALAALALVVLVVAVVVLLRFRRLGRTGVGFTVAVIVLATGTFAVTLYRSRSASAPAQQPASVGRSAVQQIGAAVLRIAVPMGHGDKQPQGALYLDPPRPGADAYTGDVSLGCYTPGKGDHDQNCAGGDRRVWTVSPISSRATIAKADGDPFADPAACDQGSGAGYVSDFVQLDEGGSYCLRQAAGDVTVALRVVAFSAARPLPADIVVQTAVLTS